MIHKEGIEIIPVTLVIADYILTPDIAVERKSVPDLIQSFKSGRLHQQAENLCRYYDVPILLIEFDFVSINTITNFRTVHSIS